MLYYASLATVCQDWQLPTRHTVADPHLWVCSIPFYKFDSLRATIKKKFFRNYRFLKVIDNVLLEGDNGKPFMKGLAQKRNKKRNLWKVTWCLLGYRRGAFEKQYVKVNKNWNNTVVQLIYLEVINVIGWHTKNGFIESSTRAICNYRSVDTIK